MQDIEDFLSRKKFNQINNFNQKNNFDFENNLQEYKLIIINLLIWIKNNHNLTRIENNSDLYRLFRLRFNQESRQFNKNQNKLNVCRKTDLLNILKSKFNKDDFDKELQDYLNILKLLLRKKPLRNVSGITSITVLTAPFPDGQTFSCKHNCYYCPNEPAHEGNKWQAQPRSYLYLEPAVQRANEEQFSAIGQMFSRMDNYDNMGHVLDKLEIIIEGGTYTEYPVDYLERYHRDLFYAVNLYHIFKKLFPNYNSKNGNDFDINLLSKIRKPLSIREEIEINKTSEIHIIGICIETRPDALDDEWLWRFRKWGVTRIQLGAQHVENSILKKINRGHTIEQLLYAMQYLKDNCFKIDIHIMPDLPGSTPEIDKAMFDYVYSIICPDQMKVYPCEVVPWTVIEKWYKNKTYIPYFENNPQDLIDVVRYSMTKCPNWVRLPRVVRDIPITYIECGNTYSNLRQMIDQQLEKESIISQDIRAREIGRNCKYYNKPAQYNIYKYKANGGLDYFIAYESYDKNALFGFLRLRILNKKNLLIFENLQNKGLVRELHVYGDTTKVNTNNSYACQHTGIGKGLLNIAEKITIKHKLKGIVVISGEGVKGYYEKHGYTELDTFMIKNFKSWDFIYYVLWKINIYINNLYNIINNITKWIYKIYS